MRSALGVVGLVLLAGIAAGALGAGLADSPSVPLVILLALVTFAPLVVRLVQRKFDPFEPIQILMVTFILLFVLRPAAELVYHINQFVGLDMHSGFNGAAAISLVGITCIYLSYASGAGGWVANHLRPLPQLWDTERSIRFAIGVLVVSALLTGAFAAAIGGPGALFRFFLGRTTTDYEAGLTTGYFVFGPILVVPVTFIMMIAFLRRRTLGTGVLFAVCLAAALFVTVPRGDRTNVVALGLPLVVLWFLRRNRRPSGAQIGVALLLAIFGMNILLATRHVETRAQNPIVKTVENAFLHPLGQIKDFSNGVDLSEFSVLELEWHAFHTSVNPLTYQPGTTIAATAAGPLPHSIVGKKPTEALVHVTNYIFPNNQRRASFGPSMFGDMFADYGWFTVVLYSIMVGIGVRALWEYYLLHQSSEGMQIVFAAALPMLVIMTRNAIPDVIARSVFFVLPLLLCLIRCSKPPRRRMAGFRLVQTSRS
jgi:oligosaccharide repeat unit polymerase